MDFRPLSPEIGYPFFWGGELGGGVDVPQDAYSSLEVHNGGDTRRTAIARQKVIVAPPHMRQAPFSSPLHTLLYTVGHMWLSCVCDTQD